MSRENYLNHYAVKAQQYTFERPNGTSASTQSWVHIIRSKRTRELSSTSAEVCMAQGEEMAEDVA